MIILIVSLTFVDNQADHKMSHSYLVEKSIEGQSDYLEGLTSFLNVDTPTLTLYFSTSDNTKYQKIIHRKKNFLIQANIFLVYVQKYSLN